MPSNSLKLMPDKENGRNCLSQHSPVPEKLNESRRPTRKRNPPRRFADEIQVASRPKLLNEEAENSLSNDNLENVNKGSSKGSLKRLRGKSKSNATDHSSDDVLNPPKKLAKINQSNLTGDPS